MTTNEKNRRQVEYKDRFFIIRYIILGVYRMMNCLPAVGHATKE